MGKRAKLKSSSELLGIGQLSFVEHALCPLDSKASLVENLSHQTEYFYSDKQRNRRRATVRVYCPLGLSPNDEYFLWGLLALARAESPGESMFQATPHFCLRRLGLIDGRSRRGGRQYRQFAQAIERLSLVQYQSDRFYDPVRGEHRKVSFGFLSYSLPLDPQSSRVWRFAWDPIFFEFVQTAGGWMRFDLNVYQKLDMASRRLFLLLSKIFARRSETPRFDLRHLAVQVVGFSGGIPTRQLKAKIQRCILRLHDSGIVFLPESEQMFEQRGRGIYTVQFHRGDYFHRKTPSRNLSSIHDTSLFDHLKTIGFDDRAIVRLTRRYPHPLLREWADITMAARERHGEGFFKKSPQAYFVDSVKTAAQGRRTAPDWWYELRKQEERDQAEKNRRKKSSNRDHLSANQTSNSDAEDSIMETMVDLFRVAGQPQDVALKNARRCQPKHKNTFINS